MPILTSCSNSLSVIPGNDVRVLTLAMPADVFTSKSGRSASVAGEPVHAAGPNSDTSASAIANAREMVHADVKVHALTDANNLPNINITLALLHS
jgi:hypothetical protein